MIIYSLQFYTASILFLYPIHDGFHSAAVHSGDRKELNKDQVILFGDEDLLGCWGDGNNCRTGWCGCWRRRSRRDWLLLCYSTGSHKKSHEKDENIAFHQ